MQFFYIVAYKKMKEDQKGADPIYSPSSIWQAQIDKSFDHLVDGLQNNDIEKFHFFLNNFGTWKRYHGVENNVFMRTYSNNLITSSYLKKNIFEKNLRYWEWYYNRRYGLQELSYPQHGNQAGAKVVDKNGKEVFVGVGSFFNEIYGRVLSNILKSSDEKRILEIGAGYGKLAYFILKSIEDFKYIDIDLPETLCLAAFYLGKSFPDKKILFYGESDIDENAFKNYDMVFLPSFAVESLSDLNIPIDLTINKNSLGEMTRDAVDGYMKVINRVTRYFFHMNHDNYPNIYSDDSDGYLGYEYPIDNEKFVELMRYHDIGHMIQKGKINDESDIFFYLYERRKS